MTNTEVATEAEKAKRRSADHRWLGPDGNTVENVSAASGIGYTSRKDNDEKGKPATGEAFTFQLPGARVGSVGTMAACFGLRTLATNTASANWQDDESTLSDVAAITERFALLKDSDWGASRGGGGSIGMDLGAMVEAIGKAKAKAKQPFDAEATKKRLTDEKDYRAAVKKVPEVMVEYAKLTGGKGTLDAI